MSTINLATIPPTVPSLCIPRVFMNIGERRIRDVFAELNLGTIDRVDIIEQKSEKGEKFKRVFVHFRNWNNNSNAREARDRLLTGNEIKIVYDDPWFWKVSALRDTRPTRSERPERIVRPEISESAERIRRLQRGENRRTRSNAIVEDPRENPRERERAIERRRPTRIISAEMCDAYDYGPNGELITCVTRKIAPNDYMCEHLTESLENPHSNPLRFPDEDCECCFCQR